MDALVEASEPGRVEFRCLHPLPPFVEDCSWKVKNCGSFVTCKTMLDALSIFASQTESCCKIHDQLLGLAKFEPESGPSSQAYAGRSDLNESQNKAVEVSLASSLTCLWGPPGTGKTHTIVVLLQELLQDLGERRILVTAPTHNAVDNVLRKFLNESSQGKDTFVEPIRVTTEVRKVAEDLRSYTCDAMIGKEVNENFAARRKAQARLKKSRLIFTTCIGSGLGLLRTEKFDTVIVDEASQQTEPASLVPLVKGCTKAVLVGDHLQLRATVEQHAAVQGFDVSLFERLYTKDTNGAQKVMLDSQYRMHPEICHFSSREFYGSNLHTAVPDEARPLPDSDFPWPSSPNKAEDKGRMIFVQCSTTEDLGRQSKSNKGQAAVCAEICKRLLRSSLPDRIPGSGGTFPHPSIAVLTPYTAQAELLGRMVPSGIPISSIDGFQGREADIVIFVTVRCNLKAEIGFLKDLRRLNVVMTRARTGCIVIGDRATLTNGSEEEESTSVWKRLLGCLTPVKIDALPDESQTEGKAKEH